MEEDLNFSKMEDDLNFSKMEDNISFFKMEDDLNLFKMKDVLILGGKGKIIYIFQHGRQSKYLRQLNFKPNPSILGLCTAQVMFFSLSSSSSGYFLPEGVVLWFCLKW
jgi:hypothetical protein